jgi:hypothetical protein
VKHRCAIGLTVVILTAIGRVTAAAEADARREHDQALAGVIHEYLAHSYPAELTRVRVSAEQVTIEGRSAAGIDPLWLAEAPMHLTWMT